MHSFKNKLKLPTKVEELPNSARNMEGSVTALLQEFRAPEPLFSVDPFLGPQNTPPLELFTRKHIRDYLHSALNGKASSNMDQNSTTTSTSKKINSFEVADRAQEAVEDPLVSLELIVSLFSHLSQWISLKH